MTKIRNFYRDILVYVLSSFFYLFLRGKILLFLQDLYFFPEWRKYRCFKKGVLSHQIPWINFASISFLNKFLKKEMKVFEYGSGGSTLFFASRTDIIISLEHNNAWHEKVNNILVEKGFCNVEYRLILPQLIKDNFDRDCTLPENYSSCNIEYESFDFREYVNSIDLFPDSYFDLVFVDGRARPSCIMHSMSKIKKYGMLLVDNTDRVYYTKSFPELFDKNKWSETIFAGHFPNGSASILGYSTVFIKLN
jgi:hypothetical protein